MKILPIQKYIQYYVYPKYHVLYKLHVKNKEKYLDIIKISLKCFKINSYQCKDLYSEYFKNI